MIEFYDTNEFKLSYDDFFHNECKTNYSEVQQVLKSVIKKLT